MNIIERLKLIMGYFAEATMKVFSPNNDSYPNTGVQPFEGDADKGESKGWEERR